MSAQSKEHGIRVEGWKTTSHASGDAPRVLTEPLPNAPNAPPVPAPQDPTIAAGRRAWLLLHNYRGCDPQWVGLWEHFIPSGGCSCKEGYKAILKDHPFDYSSPDAFFASGVALHNAVNRKLEKPEITLDDARQIWNRTDSLTQEFCNGTKCNNAGEKCCRERA
jgi:hypothetical protein